MKIGDRVTDYLTLPFLTDDCIPLSDVGVANGICPLNSSAKVSAEYLPNYTDVNYVPSNEVACVNAKQTWTVEQVFNYDDYGQTLKDNINGVACGFKAPRGLFNQFFVNDIVFTRAGKSKTDPLADEIGYYIWDGVESAVAVRDADNNIITEGYNNLLEYTKVAAITNDGGLILRSTGGSKYFKITVDDNGNLKTTQV